MSRPTSEAEIEENELLDLFLRQKTDGSIEGSIEKTLRAVELYKKLGKPKTYKIQYKKALKFLKNNKAI